CAFILLLFSNAITFYLAQHIRQDRLDHICTLHTSQDWSPIFRDVDITYNSVEFNGSFAKETIYRRTPSPEVDAAWAALGVDYEEIQVPKEDIEQAGISPGHFRLGEEYGGGYPAVIEVVHDLHCLNTLRQSLYFNSDYYHKLGKGPFRNAEPSLRTHIGHCLDSLRQTLMCTSHTGLYPFIWVGNPPHPFPDFNRKHMCRNFEDIRAFAERRQVILPEEIEVHPHEGAVFYDEIP
ncbi:hypothetical protein NA57DRAFT_17127, partial [Rhizodiscina lignyota]